MPTIYIPTPVVYAVHATATDANGRADEAPEISGAVVGSVIGFAWLVGGIFYLWKIWRRSRSVRRAGLKSHREMISPPPKPEEYIIPPDPAVIQGDRVPGEEVFGEKGRVSGRRVMGLGGAKGMPVMEEEEGSSSPTTPNKPHAASGPPASRTDEEKGPSSAAERNQSPPIPRRESGFPFDT